MSVLTTFRVIDKEATETAFEQALAGGAFSQPYYILTSDLKDSLSDADHVDPLSFGSYGRLAGSRRRRVRRRRRRSR